jgi:hypothetical protein
MPADALFIGWGEVARGREQVALEVFQESVAFWGKQQENGSIESFEPVLLAPHGGELAGFFMIRGPHAKLSEIQASPEFVKLTVRVSAVVDGSGVVRAYVGDGVAEVLGAFGEAAQGFAQH